MLQALLKQNTSWSVLGEIWLKSVMLIVTILIARTLGDTLFGIYTFIIALLQLIQIIIDFGLPLIVVRDISQNKQAAQEYFGNILSLKTILTILSFGILWIITLFLDKSPDVIRLLFIQGVFIVLYSFNGFLVTIFRAHEQFKYESFIKFIDGCILLGLILWATTFGTIDAIIYAFVITGILSVALTVTIIGKVYFWPHFSLDTKQIKQLVQKAWPLALASMFAIVYFRIDAVMLSLLQGDKPTGWYNAAYQLIYTLIFIPSFAMMSFLPKMSQLAKQSFEQFKKLYKQILAFMFTVALIIMLSVYAFSDGIVNTAYGSDFTPAILALRILTIGVFISFLAHVWLFTLTVLNKQKIYTWAVAIGMVVNIILNYIFIPKYSLYAAAWTTVATETLTGLIIFIACQRLLFSKKPHT